MRKRFRWDKKYLYWGMTAFFVVAAAILFYMALNYISLLEGAIGSLVKILSPFIWGLVISYLLVPMMRSMERPTETDTPMDRLSPSAFCGMAPEVSSYTCLLRTCTAGPAETTK